MGRRYDNASRAEKAETTRRALLDACAALLEEMPVEEVSIPRVAQRAGVTAPTAYKHFADHDALLAAFLEHLRGRIGMSHTEITGVAPERVHEIPRANYAAYEREAVLLRRVMSSPSYDRVRLAQKIDRAGLASARWASVDASDRARRAMLGPLYMLATPAAWRWLRDTWGLSARDASRSAAWAMDVLGRAVREGRSVDDVDEKESSDANPPLHDASHESRSRRERPRRDRGRASDPAAPPSRKRARVRR